MFVAYFDVFCIIVCLFSIGMGFYRGLIWEFLKYIAFFIAIALSALISYKVFHIFESSDYVFLWLISVASLVFLLVSSILLYSLKKFAKKITVSAFAGSNKILGAIFGSIRSAIFLSCLYSSMMMITLNKKPDWLRGSMSVKYLDISNIFIQKTLYRSGGSKLNQLLKLEKLMKITAKYT